MRVCTHAYASLFMTKFCSSILPRLGVFVGLHVCLRVCRSYTPERLDSNYSHPLRIKSYATLIKKKNVFLIHKSRKGIVFEQFSDWNCFSTKVHVFLFTARLRKMSKIQWENGKHGAHIFQITSLREISKALAQMQQQQ